MTILHSAPKRFETASDELHELAAGQAGSDAFGPPDYLRGLGVLLQSMDFDPHFSPVGRDMAWAGLIGALASRIHAHQAMTDNPGYVQTQLRSPVVITGISRSGTTALHRLLAVDPRFQGLQTWLLDAPMPRPPRAEWGRYPQFQRSQAEIAARIAAAPEKAAAHQSAAEGLEEDCLILRQSFTSNIWNCMGWSSPSYDVWWQTQDEAEAYRYFRKCVQLIGSSAGDERWLLKNPGHIHHLDQLFAIFPDARVIQTHRDPATAMPSMCSLLIKLHPVLEVGRTDLRARLMGTREVEKWAAGVRATDAVRAGGREAQVLDVVHGDFHRDPMGVVERIYAFIGMDLPEELRPRFAARIAARPELQHGPHRYTLEEFGLTAEGVREVFGDYTERFDMAEEGR
jgi:hypothetical protein